MEFIWKTRWTTNTMNTFSRDVKKNRLLIICHWFFSSSAISSFYQNRILFSSCWCANRKSCLNLKSWKESFSLTAIYTRVYWLLSLAGWLARYASIEYFIGKLGRRVSWKCGYWIRLWIGITSMMLFFVVVLSSVVCSLFMFWHLKWPPPKKPGLNGCTACTPADFYSIRKHDEKNRKKVGLYVRGFGAGISVFTFSISKLPYTRTNAHTHTFDLVFSISLARPLLCCTEKHFGCCAISIHHFRSLNHSPNRIDSEQSARLHCHTHTNTRTHTLKIWICKFWRTVPFSSCVLWVRLFFIGCCISAMCSFFRCRSKSALRGTLICKFNSICTLFLRAPLPPSKREEPKEMSEEKSRSMLHCSHSSLPLSSLGDAPKKNRILDFHLTHIYFHSSVFSFSFFFSLSLNRQRFSRFAITISICMSTPKKMANCNAIAQLWIEIKIHFELETKSIPNCI